MPRKEGSPRVAVLRTGRIENGPSGQDGARDERDETEQRTGWEEKVPRKPMVKRSISTEGVAGTSGFEVVFVGARQGVLFRARDDSLQFVFGGNEEKKKQKKKKRFALFRTGALENKLMEMDLEKGRDVMREWNNASLLCSAGGARCRAS